MTAAWRICPSRGCPQAIPASARYCTKHAREHEQRRGNSNQRGYGSSHQALRRAFIPEVLAGTALCWRCNEPIKPDEPWDLGHDDEDRTKYMGPEHARRCNRSAAGRRAHLTPAADEAP